MKKEVDENISKKFKKKPKNIQLMKKEESKDNSKIFGSTFTNNFTSVNKMSNRLLNQKKNNTKQPHKFNLTNQSLMNKNTIENYTSNNKTNISLRNTNTNRYNQNKKNNINNKTISSFYVAKEDKNKDKKIQIKNVKKFVLNLSLNDNIKKRNNYKKDLNEGSLSYRNNINTNNELNKSSITRKKINKEPDIKINNKEKQNKIKKDINKNNKEKTNEDLRKNKFERAKTVIKLKTQKNKEKNNSKGKSIDKKEHIDKENKGYNNLYDKYLDRFIERMHKISLIKNYRNDDEIKERKSKNKSVKKQGMIQRYKTQTNFYKKNLDKKDKEINNTKIKKTKEAPKKQITKVKIEKRKVGKSVGVKISKDKNKEKEKETELKSNIKKNNSQNNNQIKIPKRSKSMAKLTEKTKKNLNDDKYDIDYILYEPIKPSKNEDPFDDIDSIVKHLDFNVVRLKSKNIFNTEENDKYENYSKNFENVFSKAILDNNLRKSIEKNKNNDNNSNLLQNENTTDSFKKNKINVSFIDNQNN